MRWSPRSLGSVERYTWHTHWRAQAYFGLWEGILGLATFTAMRSLGAPAWIAPAAVVLTQAPWMLAPMWEHVVARLDPHRAFRRFGIGFMVPLLAIALTSVEPTGAGDGHGTGAVWWFMACYVAAYAVHGGYIAQRGAFVRANYRREIRGRLFGLLTVISRGGSIVSAKAAGWLLGTDPRWLRVLFPLAGVLAFVEQSLLATVRWRRGGRSGAARPGGAGLRETWKRSIRLLRDDRGFRLYETAWTLYGMGFLMSVPMIVVFGERDLGVSYDVWTWAQGVSMPVAGILSMAPIGRLVDRIGPVRVTAVSFACLVPFFVVLPFVTGAVGLIASFALWGVAMSGVHLGWNLGPLHFAPDGQGQRYSAAHVAIVGLRSLLAPPAGYALATWTSLPTMFLVSAALVACGAAVAWYAHRTASPA